MDINIEQAAEILKKLDNIGILVHRNPDGDCLGGGYGLCLILRKLGKKAKVLCSDKMSDKFGKRFARHVTENFEPANYIAVDVAVPELLGDLSYLADNVKLCIDHHPSNSRYAENVYLEEKSAAASELVFLLAKELEVNLDTDIATALYIGIMTDSGCFQFSNTSPRTHTIAAELMLYVFDFADINREFFSLKSKGRVMIERLATEQLHYYSNDKIAVITVTEQMRITANVDDSELDGISPIPCRIEGVEIGITIREKDENLWRVSVRTVSTADASAICKVFGGGGHIRAAGCTLEGSLAEVERCLVGAAEKELNR